MADILSKPGLQSSLIWRRCLRAHKQATEKLRLRTPLIHLLYINSILLIVSSECFFSLILGLCSTFSCYWITALKSALLRICGVFRKPYMEAADLNYKMKMPEKAVRESFSVSSDKGEPYSKEVCGLQSQFYLTSLDFQSGIPRDKCETFPAFGKCPRTVERRCWISLM